MKTKTMLLRIISILLIGCLLIPLGTASLATDPDGTDLHVYGTTYPNGDQLVDVSWNTEEGSIAEVYKNGFLFQRAVLTVEDHTIHAEIYDSAQAGKEPDIYDCMEYSCITEYLKDSEQKIPEEYLAEAEANMHYASDELVADNGNVPESVTARRKNSGNITNEPLTNDGLTVGPYDDGYFYIGETVSTDYGYPITAKMYRSFSPQYDHEAFRYTFYANYSQVIIDSYVQQTTVLEIDLREAVRGVLTFTNNGLLTVDSTVIIMEYLYNYNYKIRINLGNYDPYFTTTRTRRVYKVANLDTYVNVSKEIEQSSGYYPSNTQMINEGISNYVNYHFSDVWNHWAKDDIMWGYTSGYFTGTTLSTFSPNQTMQRADLVTCLYRVAGSPSVSGTNPFTDVPNNVYYTQPQAVFQHEFNCHIQKRRC